MGKFKPRNLGGGGGGKASPGNMLQQLQKLQEQMEQAQARLADETVTVTAGGEMIEIVITGDQRIRSIKIKPEAIDPTDPSLLEDLITAAVNEAVERSKALAAERMQGLTGGLGGLGLPGM
jgi:hypothetical protein